MKRNLIIGCGVVAFIILIMVFDVGVMLRCGQHICLVGIHFAID